MAFLDALWNSGVPLTKPIHANEGARRERYHLGPGMRAFADRAIEYNVTIEELYAVWAYAHYAGRWDRVLSDLDTIRALFVDFAERRSAFDHHGTRDETEHLNKQIAGVLAAARIFIRAEKSQDAERALALLGEVVTDRVHHERADTWLIRPTRVASKGLHQAKVPRYVGLTPELAALLKEHAGEELERNVRALMKGLPLWYQAHGERMIGGENYISPPHLSRGIFSAWADGCGAAPEELASRLDQPWCAADLYYIEKLAAILRRLDKDEGVS